MQILTTQRRQKYQANGLIHMTFKKTGVYNEKAHNASIRAMKVKIRPYKKPAGFSHVVSPLSL
jgi:hypothetical protein